MSEMVVPDGWEMLEVQDAFLLGRGRVISKPEIQNNSGIYPVYSSQSKDKGIMGKINTYDFDGEYITWTTDGAYAGTVFYRSGKFNCTNVCGTLKDKGIFDVEMRFIARYLSTVAKNHVSYVGNPKLMNGIFSEILFLLPPLPEQQKIASILTSVDEVIEKTQSQINKLQDMKKGTMNELLTKGIGHTEFKDSPVGKIPKEWEVKKFGEIARVQGGYAFKSKDAQESGARWLKIANVGIGKVVWKDKSHLPPEFLTEHRDFVLRTGDIIVALTRPILNHKLKIAMVDTPDSGALLNQRVGRILSKTDVGVRFLYYLLKSEYSVGFIEKVIFGSDPPNISGQQIESINFAIPSIQEQQKIASILSSMDSHIEEKQRKLEQTQSLKKSLMQDLLTGKVRVTVH